MIGRDKIGHAAFGALACIAGLAFTGSPVVGLALAALAGVGKEAWDATGRGTVDLWDFVATMSGGAIVAVGAWAA